MAKRSFDEEAIRINGKTVSEVRKLLGLQAKDLAVRAGISATYLSEIESGHKQPSPPVLRRLAQALGLDVGALFCSLPKKTTGPSERAVRAS